MKISGFVCKARVNDNDNLVITVVPRGNEDSDRYMLIEDPQDADILRPGVVVEDVQFEYVVINDDGDTIEPESVPTKGGTYLYHTGYATAVGEIRRARGRCGVLGATLRAQLEND